MKRVVGLILLALGVMMLLLAPLLKFYVLPSSAKTPLNTYTEATADVHFNKVLNPDKVAKGSNFPYDTDFDATQSIYVRGDVNAAEQPEAKSQDLGIFDYFMRVNRNDNGQLVTASQARYPFDRVTSELSNCCGASVNDKAVDMAGTIMPVKWGFNLQQQDYNVFNPTTKVGETWSFKGEEEMFGVPTYVYYNEVAPTKVGSQEIPKAALPGEGKNATGNVKLDQMYSSKSTYWMEPLTGLIIKGESSEYTTFNDQAGKEQLVYADYTGISGNQDAANESAALAKTVKILGSTGPLVLLILGIILIIVGLLLLRGRKGGDDSTTADDAGDAGETGDAPAAATA